MNVFFAPTTFQEAHSEPRVTRTCECRREAVYSMMAQISQYRNAEATEIWIDRVPVRLNEQHKEEIVEQVVGQVPDTGCWVLYYVQFTCQLLLTVNLFCGKCA
jgi:hypothetical protein